MTFKLLWIILSFTAGALPLAVWIGRLAGVDIRTAGDGNPGATNVFRAAGVRWGLIALLAEVAKAAAPVGLAIQLFGWQDWTIVPIALAPALGHAFSPLLGGRGGKALAAILGAWIGLTLFELPLVILPALLLGYAFLAGDGWAVLLAASAAGLYLLRFRPEPLLLAVLAGQVALILWTHRRDLARPPALRARWTNKRPSPPAGDPEN